MNPARRAATKRFLRPEKCTRSWFATNRSEAEGEQRSSQIEFASSRGTAEDVFGEGCYISQEIYF